MFCVIQEVQLKKPNQHGEYRELESYQEGWTMEGKPAKWSWQYTGGRFERPHLEAYKISIHESYRDQGRVKKRQYSIATISYYDIVEYSLYDCAAIRIEALSKLVSLDERKLYDLIESKLTPLRERLEAEFHQSEEYRTHQEHRRIIEASREARSAFCKQYEVDGGEYDRCYAVSACNHLYISQGPLALLLYVCLFPHFGAYSGCIRSFFYIALFHTLIQFHPVNKTHGHKPGRQAPARRPGADRAGRSRSFIPKVFPYFFPLEA